MIIHWCQTLSLCFFFHFTKICLVSSEQHLSCSRLHFREYFSSLLCCKYWSAEVLWRIASTRAILLVDIDPMKGLAKDPKTFHYTEITSKFSWKCLLQALGWILFLSRENNTPSPPAALLFVARTKYVCLLENSFFTSALISTLVFSPSKLRVCHETISDNLFLPRLFVCLHIFSGIGSYELSQKCHPQIYVLNTESHACRTILFFIINL